MNTSGLKFPKGFFFGSSTSSHQVEGFGNNDWSEWERTNAERLAKEATREEWPDYILNSYPSPLDIQNYISGKACDHYHRFREDFDIAKSLGHNAHRMSVSWSKVEPEEGKFNKEALEHYYEVARALRERNIEPFVTLWHWPIPNWLAQKGGWKHKSSPEYFARYVDRIVRALDQHIQFWVTLNEPEIYVAHGYFQGIWPPEEKNLLGSLKAMHKLVQGHRKAYHAIKAINPSLQVGFATNNTHFKSYGGPINAILRYIADSIWNHTIFRKTKNTYDFIGLNYYFHRTIDWRGRHFGNKFVTDVGWEIDPRGMYHVLRDLARYQKPIYVLENGLADARDEFRASFIEHHLKWIKRAVDDGVPVKGYFYWSLLDNFEWSKGFWPRFGLVEIDYKTLERKIRPSAWKFKEIIDANS